MVSRAFIISVLLILPLPSVKLESISLLLQERHCTMALPSEVHSEISTKRELQFLQNMTDTKLLMVPPYKLEYAIIAVVFLQEVFIAA
jgi:hypothetical protein